MGTHVYMGPVFHHLFTILTTCFPYYGKQVPKMGAHVYRGPVFHHLFTILTTGAHVHRGPVFGTCFPQYGKQVMEYWSPIKHVHPFFLRCSCNSCQYIWVIKVG